MQTAMLTTRIDNTVLGIIKQSAQESNITQRKFIEDAVRYFSIQKKKEDIQQSFKDLAHDKDNLELAHNGLEDLLSYY